MKALFCLTLDLRGTSEAEAIFPADLPFMPSVGQRFRLAGEIEVDAEQVVWDQQDATFLVEARVESG